MDHYYHSKISVFSLFSFSHGRKIMKIRISMMKFLLFFQLDLFIIIMLKVGRCHCELIWHGCVIPTDPLFKSR